MCCIEKTPSFSPTYVEVAYFCTYYTVTCFIRSCMRFIHFHKQKCFRCPDVLKITLSTKGCQSLKNTEQLGTIYQPISSKFSQKKIEVFLNSNRSQIQSWFQAVQGLCTGKSTSKPNKCIFVNRKLNLNLHQQHTFNSFITNPFFTR